MDIYTASEYAYKNGYEKGKARTSKEIIQILESLNIDTSPLITELIKRGYKPTDLEA